MVALLFFLFDFCCTKHTLCVSVYLEKTGFQQNGIESTIKKTGMEACFS
jgi:hypothetical protein